MSSTIYDIAREANVSIATVSRVFNKNPRVSQQTRSKVLEIAKELNYQPHVSARNLARQNTNLLAAVIPMLTNYFFMEVVRGIQDSLSQSDFDLMVYSVLDPDDAEAQIHRAMQRGGAEGTLLFSTWLNDVQADHLLSRTQPLILVDSYHPSFDSITIDNQLGGYQATKHLLEVGYRKIGLIVADNHSVPARERQQGYEKALTEYGIPIQDAYIVGNEGMRLDGFSEDAGYADMCKLLGQAPDIEAVFATSDIQAFGILKAMRNKNIKVKDDIALIGYDDIKLSELLGLSTMRQPMFDLGKTAVATITERIQNVDATPKHIVFAPELVVRDTTN